MLYSYAIELAASKTLGIRWQATLSFRPLVLAPWQAWDLAFLNKMS